MNVSSLFEQLRTKYSFSITCLRSDQQKVIEMILNRRDVFAFFPTGYEKSIMYILPPLLLDMVGLRKCIPPVFSLSCDPYLSVLLLLLAECT